MRQIASGEFLTIGKLLQMETNGLALANASVEVITDEQLKELTRSGITAMEARIKGIQQFITENNLTQTTTEGRVQ